MENKEMVKLLLTTTEFNKNDVEEDEIEVLAKDEM